MNLHSGPAAIFALLALLLTSGCSRRPLPHPQEGVSGPIAGKAQFTADRSPLGDIGYVQEEFFLSGMASSYRPAGTLSEDGRWTVVPAGTASFKTRMVVIRPVDQAHFNGTTVVEWLNVTSGADAAPEWSYIHRELLREGCAYVGVTAQRMGIEGGHGLFPGAPALKLVNPKRYETLHHPGDAFSFDIFSQAAAAIRHGGSTPVLGPLQSAHLIAVGESQSAAFLATYVNAFDPSARLFDGFFIHSRFASLPDLGGGWAIFREGRPIATRTDNRVPVLTLETETDIAKPQFAYSRAAQPDSDRFRLWEIAGAAHADKFIFGPSEIDTRNSTAEQIAAAWKAPATRARFVLDKPMNAAPQHHYVDEAAFHALNRWVAEGKLPARAARLDLTSGPAPALKLDRNGNALGGVRTPWVDVPVARLSGINQESQPMPMLLGLTETFAPARLHTLYPGGKAEYLRKFAAALDRSIQQGFLLPADRAEIMALAASLYPAP